MRDAFAQHLVCPACRGPLAVRVEERAGDRIRTGQLSCACGASYPIREFVPRFVPTDSYVDTFSFQWRKHRLTQLDTTSRKESDETGSCSMSVAGWDAFPMS
ncbi:MAG: hypothetical protein HY047_00650 [Acidobacteria bacterium]|nr:hypothetical protein [Acidobacteriota bacterium]